MFDLSLFHQEQELPELAHVDDFWHTVLCCTGQSGQLCSMVSLLWKAQLQLSAACVRLPSFTGGPLISSKRCTPTPCSTLPMSSSHLWSPQIKLTSSLQQQHQARHPPSGMSCQTSPTSCHSSTPSQHCLLTISSKEKQKLISTRDWLTAKGRITALRQHNSQNG